MRLATMTARISRSAWLSTVSGVTLIFIVFGSVVPTSGIKCIVCGLYNDGVGSITPCLNYTIDAHLKECPSSTTECIKYATGGSVVRECAPGKCTEKRADSWATSIYCCGEDACNSASNIASTIAGTFLATAITRLILH